MSETSYSSVQSSFCKRVYSQTSFTNYCVKDNRIYITKELIIVFDCNLISRFVLIKLSTTAIAIPE